jgi:AcrR family transcriptional regulator
MLVRMDTHADLPPTDAVPPTDPPLPHAGVPLPHVALLQIELPLIEQDSPARADAARNRARILCTAERLFAEHGASCVSMDQVAEAAGVGKGTLFRRFGSRAALARAVLSERERAFQEHIIRGDPPLGPGAPPQTRLVAFGHAVLDLLDSQAELIVAAEGGAARFASPPYAVYRLHITLLLREADPDCDAEFMAETLLACLGADFFLYLREVREMQLARLKAGWEELVHRTIPTRGNAAGVTRSA